MSDRIESEGKERREFVRKSLYVAPAILTLQAYSAVAKAGSVKPGEFSGSSSEKFTLRREEFEQKFQRKQERFEAKREAKRQKIESRLARDDD